MRASPLRPTIEVFFKEGIKSDNIEKRLDILSASVRTMLVTFKKDRSLQERKKSSRPATVNTRRTRGTIKRKISCNYGISINKIAMDLNISRGSVQTIVKRHFYLKSYKLCQRQFFSAQSKASRLEKSKKLLADLQVRRVSDVIWISVKVFTIAPFSNHQK
ncbi:hypothetical protein CRE_29403 [Caenorhabditis remanei]|uniref:Paired domain-containing protein n=1 Tax=Caenorhabditis remanei TaxID=31234 RepID=E3NVN2_CAERE|nr:hypothetical protein CRE_29403 [Caenorhabditis remanei]